MTTITLNPITGVPVMVTGATGYVAGWLIRRLLEEGAIVHAAVRDPANVAKTAHLTAMADALPGTIHYFKADLMEAGSHDAAMAGCRIVFHTASPFLHGAHVSDPLRDLVEPALIGTRDVLNSVNRTPSVECVVLTSSCAAISGGAADHAKAPGGILTEAIWNDVSTLENNGYSYSKTVAEKAAWEIADAQSRWKLVVVNPAFVLGAGTADSQTSASFDYIRMLGDGTFADRAPPFHIGMVDVRDIAEAHVRAAFVEEAEGRNIVFSEICSMGDLVEMLRPQFGSICSFPIDTTMPEGASLWNADNGKSKRVLGMTYRPVELAIIGMVQQMIDNGALGGAIGGETPPA